MMKNSSPAAAWRRNEELALQSARVVSVSGPETVIRLHDLMQRARTAFSCLVQPLPEDRVLCAQDETGDYFILGILERPGAQDLSISFPADAALVAEQGALSMFSGQAVTLASEGGLNCFSERTVLKSRETVMVSDELMAQGTNLKANFQSVTLVTRIISTIARQAIEKFISYIRHSEEYDQVKAGQMTRKVDGLYAMDSQNTVMVSRKNTKIDGEQIFMG